jgi:hypothetical protein
MLGKAEVVDAAGLDGAVGLVFDEQAEGGAAEAGERYGVWREWP